jgi:hypothetical protein
VNSELNPRYVVKTDEDLAADLRYCLDLVKDRKAPESVRDSAKDEAVELQAEIKARKAVRK